MQPALEAEPATAPALVDLMAIPGFLPAAPTAARPRSARWQRSRTRPAGPWYARLARDLLRGGVLLAILNLFVVQVSVVRGHSMEPGIEDGDRLLVDRLAYRMGDVHRFDVVVLRYPRDPGVDFVKRVVAMPGETVRIEAGKVFVDGAPLPADFAIVPDCAQMAQIVVPEASYFVLGDNRPISCDSREFGLVAEDLLKGKVCARLWPPSRMSVF